MFTYFQHGRRHGRRGTDPVPFSTPYAYLEASGTLPAGPTGGKFWWDMVAPGPDFTNASDVFGNPTNTITAGPTNVNSGDFHGIAILQTGLYKVEKNILIVSLYSDTTLRSITCYQGVAGQTYTSDMQFGDPSHVSQGHGQHFELFSVFDAEAPTGALLLASANGESSAYDCLVTLLITRLDDVPIVL